jgi:DNA-binding NarL/FixJ family response regulator
MPWNLRSIAVQSPLCGLAETLVVSEHTTKTHVASVLSKLDLRNRVQAVVLAYESGLVMPGA